MDQEQIEEELKKLEKHTQLRFDQVKGRMNRYFQRLGKSIFVKTQIPLPDESEDES